MEWKKINDEEWMLKDDKYSYIKIWKTGLRACEMKKRGKEGRFIFASRIGLEGKELKRYFKTEKHMQDFLKEYLKARSDDYNLLMRGYDKKYIFSKRDIALIKSLIKNDKTSTKRHNRVKSRK